MNIPKLLIFLVALSMFIMICAVAQKCEDHKCGSGYLGTEIRFPFRDVDHQPKPCGYPGFDVRCNGTIATLELPNSIILKIVSISYKEQYLKLSDTDGCLPLKLISLNLSTLPFYSMYYQEFAVFNCSGHFDDGVYNSTIDYELNKVDCLSGLNYTVYAVNALSAVSLLSSTCQWAANVTVPTAYEFTSFSSIDYYASITLFWDEPRCASCEKIYRGCRVRKDSIHEIQCTSQLYSSTSTGTQESIHRSTLTFLIVLPVIMLVVLGLMSCICKRMERTESTMVSSITMTRRNHIASGISQSTLDSYPTVVISESGQSVTSHDNTCSICLSEYKINEVLKILPQCLHRFHTACIDQWLVLDGTCPICRVVPGQVN